MLRWVLAVSAREGCDHGEHGEHGEIKSPTTWLVYAYPNVSPMVAFSATAFTCANHSNRNVLF